jgi:hypothetical protein
MAVPQEHVNEVHPLLMVGAGKRRIKNSTAYANIFATIHLSSRRAQVIGLSGFCNRDVAVELTWMYSRVLINQ